MGGALGRGLPACPLMGSLVFSKVGQVSLECLWRLSVALMDSVIKSYFRRKGFHSPHSLHPVIQVSQGRNSRQEREAENRGTPFTGWLLLACSDSQGTGPPTMSWALSISISNQENAPPTCPWSIRWRLFF